MNKESIEFQITFNVNKTNLDQVDICNANIEVLITLQNGFLFKKRLKS